MVTLTQPQIAKTTAPASTQTYGISSNLGLFSYMGWTELCKRNNIPADDKKSIEGREHCTCTYKEALVGETTESFCLNMLSLLSTAEVRLANSRSQVDAWLKLDIFIRLTDGEEQAIGLQLKSSLCGFSAYNYKYSKEGEKKGKVFYYKQIDEERKEKISFPAPAALWVNVQTVNRWEFLIFLTRKLGIPLSENTCLLRDRFLVLKRSVRGNKVDRNDKILKTLKFTEKEINQLTFLKLLKVAGSTLILS